MPPTDALLVSLLGGVLIDRCLGEPRRWHPLVGFGWLADRVERGLRQGAPGHALGNRLRGLIGWLLLVAPFTALAILLSHPLLDALLLGFALGGRSLVEHAWPVYTALKNNRLEEARQRLSLIVSRDCSRLDTTGITRAGIESVLENGNDAMFATLFWFLVAGGPGALAYRLANTLDAMWGYRDERRRYFGWAAARLDDLLNWLPARLTALTYLLLGNAALAWNCWHRQGRHWDSPNAGPVMAAGAGALNVGLGGAAWYHGQEEIRPQLGSDRPPQVLDLKRAINLVQDGLLVWLIGVALWGLGWRLLYGA